MNINSILVSQPKPKSDKNPFHGLANKYSLKVDFRSFIHVEGIDPKDFRQQRIDMSSYSAVIFTSRMAIDHYFRIAKQTRFTVPDHMKYFCVSEAVAYYLQNYVVYRKRKIFHGKQTFKDLMEIIVKHNTERYLVPCSDIQRKNIPDQLEENNIKFKNTTLYKTVCSDLSDLEEVKYDVLVFYSPSGIQSLLKNFPKFRQNGTKIAAFGQTTVQAAEKAGLRIDIKAPLPGVPSMTMAIDKYLKSNLK
jgi:uroporphyrinogen-III synthase